MRDLRAGLLIRNRRLAIKSRSLHEQTLHLAGDGVHEMRRRLALAEEGLAIEVEDFVAGGVFDVVAARDGEDVFAQGEEVLHSFRVVDELAVRARQDLCFDDEEVFALQGSQAGDWKLGC